MLKGIHRRWLYLGVALVALVQAGCAVAVLGAAAGGAALGYAYLRGALSRDYPALLGDTIRVTKTALGELGFPIVREKTDTGTAYIQTKTADNDTITIYFDLVPSSIPSEGAMTRVTVRVGYAGDDVVSARILDQISKHLKPPTGAGLPSATTRGTPTPGTPTSGGATPITPIPAPPPVPATAPPPLDAPTKATSLSPKR
jgi:hypothetical protein